RGRRRAPGDARVRAHPHRTADRRRRPRGPSGTRTNAGGQGSGSLRRDLGRRWHPAGGVSYHLRRTGPDHRRNPSRGGVSPDAAEPQGPVTPLGPVTPPGPVTPQGPVTTQGPVTLHVWRVPARRAVTAFWRVARDRSRLRRTPGVRFAKILGTSPDRSFGPARDRKSVVEVKRGG